MKKFFFITALFFAGLSGALAQSGASVKQSGNVTPGQVPWWITNGVIGGGISAADSPVTSFGVTNNGGNGICVNSDRITAAGRNVLCLGAQTNGAATISLQNYGTATAQPLQININGTSYPFPGAGTGTVLGPVSTTAGHLATWNNTVGTLLADVPISADSNGKLTTVGLVINPFASTFIPTISGVALGTLPKASAETADAGCYSAFSNDSNSPTETFLQMNLCLITNPTQTLRHVLVECIEQTARNCDVYINPANSPNQGAVLFGGDFWWGTVGSNPTSLGLGTLVPQTDANSLAAKLVLKGPGDVGMSVIGGNSSTSNVFLGSPANNAAGQVRYNNGTNVMSFAVGGSVILSISAASFISAENAFSALSATAIPAGGIVGAGLMFSSVANYGVFFGSGAPTLTAAKGSLYLRSDGTSTSTRAYINSDGGTTWVAITTAS